MTQNSRNSSASSSLSSTSPSFSSYSYEKLADIAARVVHELHISHHDDDLFFDVFPLDQDEIVKPNNDDNNNDEDDCDEGSEFEFEVLCREDMAIITADEIFHNGQIKPMYYPDFNRNESVSSDSSLEDDALETDSQETYCIWTPKKKNEEQGKAMLKKKSNSTGSGSPKWWRLKDLLHKSNSDGKDTFIFLTASQQHYKNHKDNDVETKRRRKVTAVKNIYDVYNGRKKGEGMKKTSYLPYRQDLVGFFSTVNRRNRRTIRPL